MKIESTIKREKDDLTFPCLLEYETEDGMTYVILATNNDGAEHVGGVIMYSDVPNLRVGDPNGTYLKSSFRLFSGTITLTMGEL